MHTRHGAGKHLKCFWSELLKEEFTQNCWNRPLAYEVWFFVGIDLEKCSIASLSQQWMLCSEWVPSEWVQTADNNITIIHHSSPSVNILWREKLFL